MAMKRQIIPGPWHGVITDLAPTVDINGFEDLNNYMMWKTRLRSRPGLVVDGALQSPGNQTPLNMTSFRDVEGFLHTVLFTNIAPYMLAGGVFNILTFPTYITTLTLDAPGSNYAVNDILNIIQSGGLNGTAIVEQVTGTGQIETGVPNNPGSGYTVGDVLTVVQGGGSGGTFSVTAISGGGATGPVTSVVLLDQGDGYTTEVGLATTGGTGSGFTIDITAEPSGVISQIALLNPGQGYSSASGLATSGGTGSGATVDITTTQMTMAQFSQTGLPFAVVKAQNRLYFSNGSALVCYIDGEATFKVAGDVPGSCRYLAANANHLIGAYWTEPPPGVLGSTVFPQRVRWTDSNNFTEWNTIDLAFDAGESDLINTPDNITGLSTLGNNTYVYRTNGISTMIPTGVASAPFDIPNFSIAPKGEGSPYPYSLATYNNIDHFIGNYDVWEFDGTNFRPLMDGKCNARFFADLNNASGPNQVRGFITTVLDNGFPYLAYMITIPGANVTWVLNKAEGFWSRWSWATPGGKTTGYYDLQFVEQVYLT